ncbi:leukemia inhibitory factor receptor [Pelobates fuscus]|uniref:leukemia inhibitory factor receptor n=1 Tax=Pelobates fuscus TaxID=191477 RepID=UPI002FE47091
MRFDRRMWNKLCCCLLLATIFFCLPNRFQAQNQNSSDFFQNLACVTHDIEYLLCSWSTPPLANAAIDYNICYRSSEPQRCFQTNKTQLEVELKTFTSYDIKITAMTDLGPVQIHFQKTTLDIPFIPYTPMIRSFSPDYLSDTLSVTWRWDTSSCVDGVPVKWEIQILRSENLIIVKTEELVTECSQGSTEFQWQWTSDMSLECTSHSVRIRCYVEEEHYEGHKEWSEWSDLQTVFGNPQENAYPQDKVVAVGSNITFCCTVNGLHNTIQFQSTEFLPIHISKNTSYVQLKNLNMSGDSGDNLVCNTSKEDEPFGSVIFVGYPPDIPQNFSCETHDLKEIKCTWGCGRETGLMGERSTRYTFYESNSRINISCNEDNCIFKILKGQNLYNFTVRGINVLGQSEAFLTINATERVHLLPPGTLSTGKNDPTQVFLSWQLTGRLTSLQLQCQIETSDGKGTQMLNVTFSGLNDGYYNYSVTNLHPYHRYDFRVRCAAFNSFWKWSDWSVRKKHHTSAAAPSRKLTVWREITWASGNRTITVYWKPFSITEANGPVHYYEVSWKPLKGNIKPKSAHVSSNHSNKQIILNNDKEDYEISVVANNSAGSSPPSRITTVQLPNDHVEVEQQIGTSEGINITWLQDTNVSCGHVIEWRSLSNSSSPLLWNQLPSHSTSAFIHSGQFPAGERHNISVFSCKDNKYKLLKMVTGYTQELTPAVAPNFTVERTSSESVHIKWDTIPDKELRGFLQGYVVYVVKQEQDTPHADAKDLVLHAEKKEIKNVTDPTQTNMTIGGLQGGTSYYLGFVAYTRGGQGLMNVLNVVTNDNAMGLILAILIPIVIAVLLSILTSTICYQKREWIKETFYPDIPNPENSKALQFQKNVTEGNKNVKVLEMNPCTPNNVEVVQTIPKVLDTELNSPITDDLIKLPEDGLETTDNHVVVSYCPPATNEDTSHAELDHSGVSSQVVYIDVQSMYQPQGNSEEELENDLDTAGYKPQMHLAINTVNMDSCVSSEDTLAEASGYRPQGNPQTWAAESPGSPSSLESNIDNASFGSPCSVNSRHFLIPPVDDKDSLKPTHVGWSISSLFQNKQDD